MTIGGFLNISTAGASLPPGRIIYSANFSNPVAKWHQSGSTLAFQDNSYVIRSTSNGQHLIGGPNIILPQASISLQASINSSASGQSGFGVFCLADYKNTGFGISFLVHRNGSWTIWEQAGRQPIKTVASGALRSIDVTRETSVIAICDAIPHSSRIGLGLYVDGKQVSSLTEHSPKVTKPWLVGINVFGDASIQTIVKAKSFVIRNLTKSPT
jgi:hypothetical protein